MFRSAIVQPIAIWAAALITIGMLTAGGAALAHHSQPNAQAACVATTPIDTGNRAEDSQPAYTARLARAGWDFKPNCDGVNDWYPVGHRCHSGHVVYPSGSTVG